MQHTNEEGARGPQSSRVPSILAVVGAVALGGLAFWGARNWLPAGSGYERLALSSPCDLRSGPCEHRLDAGGIQFAISPTDLPLMQTLTLDVRLDGIDADRVQVSVRGLNMDMGLNLTELKQVEPGSWRGETILPICSQRRMEWEAAVLLDADPPLEVAFPFHTERP
jgi:hypothetical protein